jgi:plastocyanin
MKTLIGSKSTMLTGIAIIFATLSISDSRKKSSDTGGGPGMNEVWIQGMAFNPGTITVAAGTTITWTNKDGVAHTVTSTTGLFNSGSINPDAPYSHLFATAGTYPYKCTIHPNMNTTVVVN